MRALLALLVGLLTVAGLAWHFGWRLPAVWNPWAPLDVKAEPNVLTRYKLMRLRAALLVTRTAVLWGLTTGATSPPRHAAMPATPSAHCWQRSTVC